MMELGLAPARESRTPRGAGNAAALLGSRAPLRTRSPSSTHHVGLTPRSLRCGRSAENGVSRRTRDAFSKTDIPTWPGIPGERHDVKRIASTVAAVLAVALLACDRDAAVRDAPSGPSFEF